ncbi:hypothetical protein IFM89_006948 [Coptis chinensis]|uniref:Mitochondrial glycoprotein n=1 Tax=Coptis chinensis TaxID=261450 RepID=A0A835LQN9_9MAGN|nr:hypothetical protein IFM89_006948 [Coptis chinensis]
MKILCSLQGNGELLKLAFRVRAGVRSAQRAETLMQGFKGGSLGGFEMIMDEKRCKDVELWRKCESGEEIIVSAMLGEFVCLEEGETSFPYKCLMKVFIRKPELSSILQFNCGVVSKGCDLSEFSIYHASCLPQSSYLNDSVYKGPLFSDLDPQLQATFKEYLIARGIGENLTNFLLLHLHKKETDQYVNWLGRLEAMISKDA